mmetsp:Transcript_73147/g.201855  ORF Transcript_73147/g.201855 Transcript_73147/m.201855 type:complete len:149 (-) Transcript_73147:8-454(-)
MMESLQKQQRREELLTQPRAKCVPSQEQRKLDSLKSNFAPATGARAAAQTAAGCPERQEQGELQEPTLLDLLQQVRPDWNDKEVKQVQDKMAKIGIRSLQDLFQNLCELGPADINIRLKQAGQKQLKLETLNSLYRTLSEYYESTGVP